MTTTKSIVDVLDIEWETSPYRHASTEKLVKLLEKLGIKSAYRVRAAHFPGPLRFESLEATLKCVTFDIKDLVLWPKVNSGTKEE